METDTFKIDGSKIIYHPERISQWIKAGSDWNKAKKVYPIYVEISPMGACNHRCTFCAVDYIGYQNRSLDENNFMETIQDMGALGVKSVMYAGEGEPLLYKPLSKIIKHAKESGIDNSITTNATPLTERFANESLPYITWIKASINAGSPENYAKIHRAKEGEFERAFSNMQKAVEVRRSLGLDSKEHTLGAQMVLLPENAHESFAFASRAKESGLDYAVIIPYSQHKKSITEIYKGQRYEEFMKMEEKLDSLQSDSFKVIFRKSTMKELSKEDPSYFVCPSTPFMWAYIMASGDVYSCSAYLEDERFNLGNIQENTFQEIWEGEKRKANMEFVLNELDISECRKNCRMHPTNLVLDKLSSLANPLDELFKIDQSNYPNHINFI